MRTVSFHVTNVLRLAEMLSQKTGQRRPIELATGYLAKSAGFLESILEGVGGIKLMNPLKEVVRPYDRIRHGDEDI